MTIKQLIDALKRLNASPDLAIGYEVQLGEINAITQLKVTWTNGEITEVVIS